VLFLRPSQDSSNLQKPKSCLQYNDSQSVVGFINLILLCFTISSLFLNMQIVAACDLARQEDEQATSRAVKNAKTK
jgi:hypothetical protein